MLSLRTILPHTLELLKSLSAQPELKGMRLVGGTSLALQYGHRQSVDLDFFGHMEVTMDEVIEMFHRIGGSLLVLNRTKNILQVVVDGVKVDVVNYSCYDWIDCPIEEDGIVLASAKDIAALKINAIEGRGSKKDFVDVYLLLQHFSLDDILTFYAQKYPEYSILRALFSLTYFADAEDMDMPTMLIDDSWEKMKETISLAVKEYQSCH